jgi:hypothetical protein
MQKKQSEKTLIFNQKNTYDALHYLGPGGRYPVLTRTAIFTSDHRAAALGKSATCLKAYSGTST